MKSIMMIAALAALSAGCSKLYPDPEPTAAATAARQTEVQIKQIELQTENQKRLMELQLTIAKACADRGMIPLFLQGNVECKEAPKK